MSTYQDCYAFTGTQTDSEASKENIGHRTWDATGTDEDLLDPALQHFPPSSQEFIPGEDEQAESSNALEYDSAAYLGHPSTITDTYTQYGVAFPHAPQFAFPTEDSTTPLTEPYAGSQLDFLPAQVYWDPHPIFQYNETTLAPAPKPVHVNLDLFDFALPAGAFLPPYPSPESFHCAILSPLTHLSGAGHSSVLEPTPLSLNSKVHDAFLVPLTPPPSEQDGDNLRATPASRSPSPPVAAAAPGLAPRVDLRSHRAVLQDPTSEATCGGHQPGRSGPSCTLTFIACDPVSMSKKSDESWRDNIEYTLDKDNIDFCRIGTCRWKGPRSGALGHGRDDHSEFFKGAENITCPRADCRTGNCARRKSVLKASSYHKHFYDDFGTAPVPRCKRCSKEIMRMQKGYVERHMQTCEGKVHIPRARNRKRSRNDEDEDREEGSSRKRQRK